MPQVRRAAYLLIAILTVALVVSLAWKPAKARQFHKIDVTRIPMSLDGYTGADESLDSGVAQALYSAQVVSRVYRSTSQGDVSFALIGGADRDALHDPRSCIVGAGGRIDNARIEALPGQGIDVTACDAVFDTAATSGGAIGDTIYFYVTPEGIVSDPTKIRAKMLLTAFEQKGEPVFFVKCMVTEWPNSPDNVRKREHQRLLDFTSAMWRRIAPVLTQGLKA